MIGGIDKLYTQIGKVFRLYLRIEPFAALFWALGNVLPHILKLVTQPAGLASLNRGTGAVLYSVQQGSVRFNLTEEARPRLPFPLYVYLLFVPTHVLPSCLTH